jgi:hypothetical protein
VKKTTKRAPRVVETDHDGESDMDVSETVPIAASLEHDRPIVNESSETKTKSREDKPVASESDSEDDVGVDVSNWQARIGKTVAPVSAPKEYAGDSSDDDGWGK